MNVKKLFFGNLLILPIALFVDKLWFYFDVLIFPIMKRNGKIEMNISQDFISGNYFKNLATIVIDDEYCVKILDLTPLDEFHSSKQIYFVDMSRTNPLLFNAISGFLSNDSVLICHNGDKLDLYELEIVKKNKLNIFAVNSVDDKEVVALPIGLENSELNRNGKTDEFIHLSNILKSTKNNRPITLCVNFRLRTNRLERMAALKFLTKNSNAKFFWLKSSNRMHDLYKKSKFVISPPGNGNDCHRTWESLYCGAVPIVLKDHIDSNLIKDLPILVVENYGELSKLTAKELERIYVDLWSNANLNKLSPTYWKTLINES